MDGMAILNIDYKSIFFGVTHQGFGDGLVKSWLHDMTSECLSILAFQYGTRFRDTLLFQQLISLWIQKSCIHVEVLHIQMLWKYDDYSNHPRIG